MRGRGAKGARPARYLDLLALRRGDLILSGYPSRESRLIARQTDGPFSHVAIVRSFAQRFEALGDGVGLTNHRVDRLERRDGRLCALMRMDESVCLVLRHRAAVEDDEAARLGFARAVFRLIGVRYSSLDRLLLALPESHLAAPLSGPVVRRLASVRRKILHHRLRAPGLFCSEVAAEIYHEMGWELPGVAPTRVSPNDIYRIGMTGPLVPVAGAVMEAGAACLRDEEVEADGRAADLMDAMKELPPGRFKVDELIKEKDHWYVKRVVARHLADVVRAALGTYVKVRKKRRPVLVSRLEHVLEELERFEEKARAHDAAAGLDRKVGRAEVP
jgi:hypothetical protein